jgi:hypothetical protein
MQTVIVLARIQKETGGDYQAQPSDVTVTVTVITM